MKVDVSAAGQQALRNPAFNAVRKVRRVADVADAFGVIAGKPCRGFARYAKEGHGGLEKRARDGRPSRTTADEMAWIGKTVQDETPQQSERPCAPWTLSLTREPIGRHRGKTLALSSFSRVTNLLRFSVQTALCEAWNRTRYGLFRGRRRAVRGNLTKCVNSGQRSTPRTNRAFARTSTLERSGGGRPDASGQRLRWAFA